MVSIENVTPGQIYANVYNARTVEESTTAFRQMISLASEEMKKSSTFEQIKAHGKNFLHNLFLRLFKY